MKFLSISLQKYLSWSQQKLLRQLCQQRLYTTDIQDSAASSRNNGGNEYNNFTTGEREETELLVRSVDRGSDDLYKKFLVKPDQPPDAHMLRVAIIGAPNAGKSTVVNSLLGWKINAVSSKVHTTRRNTNGMMTEGKSQILFVDTPGVLTASERKKHSCDGQMVTDPEKSVHEVDLVGVVVDVSNKWTRNQLHVEILKVLHLHSTVPSFLVLNKVDCLKWKQLTLDVTRKLTCGVVNGRLMAFTNKLKTKPSHKTEKTDFDKLENKYGKLKGLKQKGMQREENTDGVDMIANKEDRIDEEWMKDFAAALKRHAESNDGKVENLSSRKEKLSPNETKVGGAAIVDDLSVEKIISSDHSNSVTINSTESDILNRSASDTINRPYSLEESYQSEHLSNVLSEPSRVTRNILESEDEESFDWTQKVAKIKQATVAAKKKPGWEKFERVFIVSALHGDGIPDIKEYLLDSSQPGDWQYHSSLVTDQDPYELATMCVWQAILDHCRGAIPYMVYPEIVYWQVADDGRLSIIMEINVKNTYLAENIIGKNGSIIKEISADAKQALLNAFRCDLQLKLVIKVKKSTGRR